jgi:hypothetical protein
MHVVNHHELWWMWCMRLGWDESKMIEWLECEFVEYWSVSGHSR